MQVVRASSCIILVSHLVWGTFEQAMSTEIQVQEVGVYFRDLETCDAAYGISVSSYWSTAKGSSCVSAKGVARSARVFAQKDTSNVLSLAVFPGPKGQAMGNAESAA